MSIIWLILKILLYIILFLIGSVIILIAVILISPIHYEIYFSKDEEINYDIKIKYLKVISANFAVQNGVKVNQAKIISKIIHFNGTQDEETAQYDDSNLDSGQPCTNHTETSIRQCDNETDQYLRNKQETHKETYNNKQTEYNNDSSDDVHNNIRDTNDLNKKQVKSDETKKVDKQKLNVYEAMGGLNGVKSIIVCTLVFIKDLLVYISPREYSFEIVVGKDDPSDTGELVAKLIMMYPFYYKHGIIRGDYENEGIKGGCLLEGKLRLGGIIGLVIKFLLRTPVRTFLKNILYNKRG